MSKRTRKLLFWLLFAVFLLGGSAVILYAQGWRLDTATLRPRKVGAIYVHTAPAEAALFLDGKPVPRNLGLFSDSTLINNLFPKRYRLEAKADGYQDWHATVAVEPSVVSEIKSAILIPNAPRLTAGNNDIVDFQIINGEIAAESAVGWRIGGNKLVGKEIAGWDKNSNILTAGPEAGGYFLNSGDSGLAININSLLKRTGIAATQARIILSRDGSQNLIVLAGRTAWLVNPRTSVARQIGTLKTGELFGDLASGSTAAAWVSFSAKIPQSRIWIYDHASGKLQITNASAQEIKSLFWLDSRLVGLILENNDFFIYDAGKNELTKKASDAKSAALSENGRLAVLENRSLEIFSDRDGRYWRFNLPGIESANRLEWIGDLHLLIHYPDEVRLLSLEDNSLENFAIVAEAKTGYFEPETGRFYFLRDGNLYLLSFQQE